jgi:hypothetical protein
MKPLALLLMLASPTLAAPQAPPAAVSTTTIASTTSVQAATPPPGSLDSSKIRLDSQDATGALADAETALAHGGGADAYAARADAQLALGRPLDRVIEDYGKAAKLDSAYLERYEGLIAQRDSETNPKARFKTGGVSLGNVADSLAMILAAAAVSWLILVVALVMLKGRETRSRASDDEQAGPNKPS